MFEHNLLQYWQSGLSKDTNKQECIQLSDIEGMADSRKIEEILEKLGIENEGNILLIKFLESLSYCTINTFSCK